MPSYYYILEWKKKYCRQIQRDPTTGIDRIYREFLKNNGKNLFTFTDWYNKPVQLFYGDIFRQPSLARFIPKLIALGVKIIEVDFSHGTYNMYGERIGYPHLAYTDKMAIDKCCVEIRDKWYMKQKINKLEEIGVRVWLDKNFIKLANFKNQKV